MATIPPLVITEEERAELERRVRAYPSPQRAAKQARIVLLAADSLPTARSPHGRHAPLPCARRKAGPVYSGERQL
jgi:hypothetical protein